MKPKENNAIPNAGIQNVKYQLHTSRSSGNSQGTNMRRMQREFYRGADPTMTL